MKFRSAIHFSALAIGLAAASQGFASPKQHASQVVHKKAAQTQVVTQDAVTANDIVLSDNESNMPSMLPEQEKNVHAIISENKEKGVLIKDQPWYSHIYLSGLVNVDASHWSKPNFGLGNGDTSASNYVSLSAANLNIDADINPWATAHVGLLYLNGSSPEIVNYRPDRPFNRRLNVEEAYATIADFSKMPFYLRAGQQYVPFGKYERYPITKSLTQILSQTNLPSMEVGFVTHTGFYGTLTVMSGENKIDNGNKTTANDAVASVGYQNFNHPVGYDAGVAYINNMADVDAIRSVVKQNNGYTQRVAGMSAYGDVYAGPFGLSARYVSALGAFSKTDFQYTEEDGNRLKKARPSAADITAHYAFHWLKRNNQLEFGYQWSQQARNTATGISGTVTRLPKYRWAVGYGINLVPSVAMLFDYTQDHDYKVDNGGTGKTNNVYTLRFSYLF